MDNRLRFSNILLRAGLSQAIPLENGTSALMLMIGLQAHSIYYTLDQHDLALGATRLGDESWMEWMRSWGAVLRLPAVEIHYLARLTTGGGRPGAAFPSGPIAVDGVASSAPFPGPFTGTTTLSGVHVMTQQLSVSLPIR
jgi:hypothetical protein